MEILAGFINMIGLICLVWFFTTGSYPIQFAKQLLNIHSETKTKNDWLFMTAKLVNCSMCTGFWVGLGYYQNILHACLFAILCELFSVNIDKHLLK